MTTAPVSRSDIARLAEDLGGHTPPSKQTDPNAMPSHLSPCPGCGKPKDPACVCETPGCSTRGNRPGANVDIRPPPGVVMASGSPAAREIEAIIPVVMIRFKRGRVIMEDPIGTIIALEEAPTKLKTGSGLELAKLLRNAITSTTEIEFDQTEAEKSAEKQEDKELTFTETRAISDALLKWADELGKS